MQWSFAGTLPVKNVPSDTHPPEKVRQVPVRCCQRRAQMLAKGQHRGRRTPSSPVASPVPGAGSGWGQAGLAGTKARGTTPEALVRNALKPIIAASDPSPEVSKPKVSLLGVWARYGPGPTEEDIDENRAEMFSTFGRDDIA